MKAQDRQRKAMKPKAKKRVFKGWIDPDLELPKKVEERTQITFGNSRWHPITDRKCKITVEWEPK